MKLFDILSNGERIIVHSRVDHSQVYTWNQSLTLQCWDVDIRGNFVEVEAQVLSDVPLDYFAARQAAINWCNNNAAPNPITFIDETPQGSQAW